MFVHVILKIKHHKIKKSKKGVTESWIKEQSVPALISGVKKATYTDGKREDGGELYPNTSPNFKKRVYFIEEVLKVLIKMKKMILKKFEKKLFIYVISGIVLVLGSVFYADAQVKIDSYSMSILGNQDNNNFNISIDDNNTLWIDAYATYNHGFKCGLKIKEFLQPDFIYILEKAKEKYSEWKNVCFKKGITEIKKKMEYIFAAEGYFSFLNTIRYDKNVMVIFAFTYFKGDYILIMNLEKMTASDNENFSFDGTSVIFNSEQEIDSFISKISQKSIHNYKAKLN